MFELMRAERQAGCVRAAFAKLWRVKGSRAPWAFASLCGARGAHALPGLLISLFTFHFSPFALADGDSGFNYQAEIRDANGAVLVDDTGAVVREHSVKIRLYSVPTGGTALWGRSYDVRTDDNGLFCVYLSDSRGYPIPSETSNALADVIRDHAPGGLYVGLTVGEGGTEILPRQRICATPYATVVKTLLPDAKALGPLTVNGALTVDGTLTANSVSVKGLSELISVPIGAILLWTNDLKAPDGASWDGDVSANKMWAKCTGQTVGSVQTPDLSGRFVVGVGSSYSLTSRGGAATMYLNVSEMPKHTHSLAYSGTCPRCYYMHALKLDSSNGARLASPNVSWSGSPEEGSTDEVHMWFGGETTEAGGRSGGGVDAHENRPPYYGVIFVMRVK